MFFDKKKVVSIPVVIVVYPEGQGYRIERSTRYPLISIPSSLLLHLPVTRQTLPNEGPASMQYILVQPLAELFTYG